MKTSVFVALLLIASFSILPTFGQIVATDYRLPRCDSPNKKSPGYSLAEQRKKLASYHLAYRRTNDTITKELLTFKNDIRTRGVYCKNIDNKLSKLCRRVSALQAKNKRTEALYWCELYNYGIRKGAISFRSKEKRIVARYNNLLNKTSIGTIALQKSFEKKCEDVFIHTKDSLCHLPRPSAVAVIQDISDNNPSSCDVKVRTEATNDGTDILISLQYRPENGCHGITGIGRNGYELGSYDLPDSLVNYMQFFFSNLRQTFDRNNWEPNQALLVIVGMADGHPLVRPRAYTGFSSTGFHGQVNMIPGQYKLLDSSDYNEISSCGHEIRDEFVFRENSGDSIRANFQIAYLRAYAAKLAFDKFFTREPGKEHQRVRLYAVDNPQIGPEDGAFRRISVYIFIRGGASPTPLMKVEDQRWLRRIIACP